MAQRSRKDIMREIRGAERAPSVGPSAEQRLIDLAVVELLADIRDGLSYMVESQKRFDAYVEAEHQGKLPPRS